MNEDNLLFTYILLIKLNIYMCVCRINFNILYNLNLFLNLNYF